MKSLLSVVLLFFGVTAFGKSSVEDFLFTVECEDGSSGSAFLMKDTDGAVWMVSNYHVIAGATNAEFTSMSNEDDTLGLPEEIEVAADRDAVRFRVDREDGFCLSTDCQFDDTVFAFGNSGGLGVITKSEGTVVGKGRRDLEVSCEIIPGNSGGPVINSSNEVVGVASYIVMPAALELSETLMKNLSSSERKRLERRLKEVKGTRYEGTRRFAIPIDEVEWQQLSFEEFIEESEAFELRKIQLAKIRNILSVAFMMTKSISEEAGMPFIKKRWIRQYNRDVPGSLYYYSGMYYVRDGSLDSFYRRYSRALFDLHDKLQEAVGDQIEQAKEELSLKYFLNELDEQNEMICESFETMITVAEECKR